MDISINNITNHLQVYFAKNKKAVHSIIAKLSVLSTIYKIP